LNNDEDNEDYRQSSRYGGERGSNARMQDRDEYGRFEGWQGRQSRSNDWNEDEDNEDYRQSAPYGGERGSNAWMQDRDQYGRFESDDDQGWQSRQSRSNDWNNGEDNEDYRQSSRYGGERGSNARMQDRDEDGRFESRENERSRQGRSNDSDEEDYRQSSRSGSRRGFASMDENQRREIASRGGRSHSGR